MSVETDYHERREMEARLMAETPPTDRLAALERIRSAAWAYVNAPKKFGIRYQAYRSLIKALEECEP